MSEVEAGCASPLGALCQPKGGGFSFEGALLSLDGKKKLSVSRKISKNEWRQAGNLAAKELLANGGATLMKEIRRAQPKDILCLKEIDKEQRKLGLEMGLKLHDIEVLNLIPTSFEIEVADIAIVASSFGAEQLKKRQSKMPKKMWVVGQKATDLLINSGYSGKITTYRNSDDLVKAYKEKQPGTAVYYGAERTSQDWVKCGIRHIVTYRNSTKPPHLARQQWDAILVFSPLGAESALAENEFPKNTPVVCIGKRTAKALKKHDFTKVVAAPHPDFTALLQTLKNKLS